MAVTTSLSMSAVSGYPTQTAMRVTVSFSVRYAQSYYVYFEVHKRSLTGTIVWEGAGSTYTMSENSSKSNLPKTIPLDGGEFGSGTTYYVVASLWNASTNQRLDIDEPYISFTTLQAYTVTINYYDSGLQGWPEDEEYLTVRSSGYHSYSGYSFMGWGTSTYSTDVVYTGGETLYAGSSSDRTYNLYAIYRRDTTIYCYYGDHTNPSYNTRERWDWRVQRSTSSYMTITTLSSKQPALPGFAATTFYSTDPSGVAWTPRGWRTDITPGEPQIKPGAEPDANYLTISTTAYYAVYSRTVTISYNANGGSGSTSASTGTAYYNSAPLSVGGYGAKPASITLKTGSVFTPPDNRVFDHWDIGNADDSGVDYAAGATLTTSFDLTLFAIWSAVMPARWAWTSTIGGELTIKTDSSGVKYVTPLTATEWNNFIDRVCEWITYKDAAYYPTYYTNARATAGTTMTASQASYCVKLMTPLYPSVAVPAAPSGNNPITAAFINGLADSLNSLLTS